jgi:hypothetical protein
MQPAWPTLLAKQLEARTSIGPLKGFAPDDTRLGLLPVVRRCMPAGGVQPVAPVPHQGDNGSVSGAVEPTPGVRCLLALPARTLRALPLWGDGCAVAWPEACTIRVLDNGAGHTATAVRGPANVVPGWLPPSRPALHPMERLWRDRKAPLADVPTQTITALAAAVCAVIQSYAPAPLHSLTSLTDVVQAVETVQKVLRYSSLP